MSMVGDTMTSSVPELMLTLENYKVKIISRLDLGYCGKNVAGFIVFF